MPKFSTNSQVKAYFSKKVFTKTVQPNYKFYVTIIDKAIFTSLPLIKHWHVLSVNVPNYDWKKEVVYYGPLPKSYPYLETDGLEFKIVFEEDEMGTIGDFLHSFQKRILNQDGTYNAPNNIKINRILVSTEDRYSLPVALFTFHDCYLLQAGEVEYNYASNESVKYDTTWNCDYYSAQFPKRGAINLAKAGLGAVAGKIREKTFGSRMSKDYLDIVSRR